MRAGKGFTLFISNEDMIVIIKIIKSLKHSGVLIDGVTETVRDEINKQEGRFVGALLLPLAASLVQPVISSVVKGISGRGVKYFLVPLHPLNKIKDKSVTHNMYRIQDNESIIYGFYCIAFVEYMLAEKALLTNLFSPNDYKKNDKIIYKHFKDKYGRRNKPRV